MSEDVPSVGERIQFLREARGLSREKFARAIQLAGGKADKDLIWKWENNKARPSAANQRPFIRAITPVASLYPHGANTTAKTLAVAQDTTPAEWKAVVKAVSLFVNGEPYLES